MTDICNLCGKLAALMCQRCNETYCSTNCQILDWRVHKKVCFQMPTLVPIKELGQRDVNSTNSRYIDTDSHQSGTSTDNKHGKRVPPRSVSANMQSEEKPKTIVMKDKCSETIDNKATQSEYDLNLKARNPSKDCDTLMKSSASQSSKISVRNTAWRTPYKYPEGIFFDVIVQYVEEETGSGVVWVTELKYEGPLRKFLAEINRNIDTNTDRCPPEEIHVGALIAAPFENLYYRAEILKIVQSTKTVTAHLIDYGNVIEVSFKDLRSPIPIMRNLNAYAFKIRYNRPVAVENLLTIRVIDSDKDGVLKIEERAKHFLGSMPVGVTAETFATNSTASLVKISDNGNYALLCFTGERFIDELNEMNKLMNSETSVSGQSGKVPRNGEFVVAACSPHGWSRALVLSTYQTNYLVYLVDVGRVELVEQVMLVPKKFQTIPMRVFCVKFQKATAGKKDFTECLFYDKVYTIKVQKHAAKLNNDNISCTLLASDEKKVAEVEAFNYMGKNEEIGVNDWFEPLISGSTVYITNVVSHFEVFISLVCTKVYPQVFSAAAKSCDVILPEKICQGDLVLAMSEDGKYFRARILDTTDGSVKVLNVDSGLLSTVPSTTLRKPNLFVLSCPYHTWNVKLMYLSNVATPYANNKALATLEQCQQKGAEFILKFDSHLELSVELLLKNADQQSLNKKLLPMLFEKANNFLSEKIKENLELDTVGEEYLMTTTPPLSPKVADPSDERNTFKDLKVIPITCGDNVPLMVLDTSTISKGFISACDLTNREFLVKLESTYLPMVKKYCASLKKQDEYWPNIDEICLAVYDMDKEWYRALCLSRMEDGTVCVMFIDYGNICRVHKANIRKITPELMFPTNANVCILEDVPDDLPQKVCDKFVRTVQKDPKIIGKITKLEQDSYLLSIKDKNKYF